MSDHKTYKVKEIYYTLQGEGHHSGRPAVFVRFSGCNLWSGREKDRSTAICRFCDTDFWGMDGPNGGKYTATALTETILSLIPEGSSQGMLLVCTGGEPALQLDERLLQKWKTHGLEIAIETNGTLGLPEGIDWVCMSPKAGTDLLITTGNELKLVYPQEGLDPADFISLDFDHFYLQPMDGPQQEDNTATALAYCKANPQWKLSLQTHKILRIP